MNGRKQSQKTSPLTAAAAKTVSAPQLAPAAGGTIYNPARAGDGTAAKIWELLRRNPKFIHRAEVMLRLSIKNTKTRSGLNYVNRVIMNCDSIIGSFVLRWLFRPRRWEFNFPPEIPKFPIKHFSATRKKSKACWCRFFKPRMSCYLYADM